MARRTNKFIETVSVMNLRAEYKLYLTPENGFAAYFEPDGADKIKLAAGKTAGECQGEAFRALKALLELDWKPAIMVDFPAPAFFTRGLKTVSFAFDRGYMAYSAYRKTWLWEKWNSPPQYRTGETVSYAMRAYNTKTREHETAVPVPAALPFEYTHSAKDAADGKRGPFYMPYSEEKWNALNDLALRLGVLDKLLKEIVAEPELMRLRALLTPALNASSMAGDLLSLPAPQCLPDDRTGVIDPEYTMPSDEATADAFTPVLSVPVSRLDAESYAIVTGDEPPAETPPTVVYGHIVGMKPGQVLPAGTPLIPCWKEGDE
jgi:hypothetical protein